jgi:2-polyprenyl-6-methoxyphenol hydroxylase-like FAD-dependent oxidoreductase
VLPHRAAGAVSAIEDAEALSVFLRGAIPDSVHDALQRVFRVRYKRVSEIQAGSRADGLLSPPDPHAGEVMMRLWDYPGAQRWMDERPEMVLEA